MQAAHKAKSKKQKACGVQAQAWRRRKIEVSRRIFNQIKWLREVDNTSVTNTIEYWILSSNGHIDLQVSLLKFIEKS
jgi:hypothetical protein